MEASPNKSLRGDPSPAPSQPHHASFGMTVEGGAPRVTSRTPRAGCPPYQGGHPALPRLEGCAATALKRGGGAALCGGGVGPLSAYVCGGHWASRKKPAS